MRRKRRPPTILSSLIRYPGSKAKIAEKIQAVLPAEADFGINMGSIDCYCEPFAGTCIIGWNILQGLCCTDLGNRRPVAIINDMDLYICRMWQAVRDDPEGLKAMVKENEPGLGDFERYKSTDGDPDVDPLVCAYRKIVLHQTSFSGTGAMAGSVIGGKDQRSAYNYLCRWNPVRICSRITQFHEIIKAARAFNIMHGDFAAALAKLDPGDFAYLDPPYYVQGKVLYKYNMSEADHVRLAQCLRKARYRFVLSYDDHPHIRQLYEGWTNIRDFAMTPTVQTKSGGTRRKNNELLISNFVSQAGAAER